MFGSQSFLISHSRSEELRKEARQLKKELQAIKQRKEESLKPAEDKAKEGMWADLIPLHFLMDVYHWYPLCREFIGRI